MRQPGVALTSGQAGAPLLAQRRLRQRRRTRQQRRLRQRAHADGAAR